MARIFARHSFRDAASRPDAACASLDSYFNTVSPDQSTSTGVSGSSRAVWVGRPLSSSMRFGCCCKYVATPRAGSRNSTSRSPSCARSSLKLSWYCRDQLYASSLPSSGRENDALKTLAPRRRCAVVHTFEINASVGSGTGAPCASRLPRNCASGSSAMETWTYEFAQRSRSGARGSTASARSAGFFGCRSVAASNAAAAANDALTADSPEPPTMASSWSRTDCALAARSFDNVPKSWTGSWRLLDKYVVFLSQTASLARRLPRACASPPTPPKSFDAPAQSGSSDLRNASSPSDSSPSSPGFESPLMRSISTPTPGSTCSFQCL
mmetsp:Transcript_6708/g.21123  ORF Transcript_6708/g.21123 Transcript_6708/m.21123 type:complete len:325 (+) Transcript_6708:125-1099(+)